MIEVKREYSRSRIEHAAEYGVRKLTEQEKINLGLKRPAPPTDLVEIVMPVHRTASSMAWETRLVSRASLQRIKKEHPNIEMPGEGRTR